LTASSKVAMTNSSFSLIVGMDRATFVSSRSSIVASPDRGLAMALIGFPAVEDGR
jgi:hypothetical protein